MHAIFYNGAISPKGVRNAQVLIADAIQRNLGDITLVVTSNGGDVTAGMGLYHFIRAMAFPIAIHAAGVCSSIAATILLASDHRSAADPTQFALHAPTYVDGPFVGQVAPNLALISQPFRQRLGWDDGDISAHFRSEEETQITLEDALSTKLIHGVRDLRLNPTDTMINVAMPD
jgi:hypothetical protein